MKVKLYAASLTLALLSLAGCGWEERLPFVHNELAPSLVGFWWRVLPDTTYAFALRTQALVEFKRGEETNTVYKWSTVGFSECPHVHGRGLGAVFTKRGMIYRMPGFSRTPYSLRGDALTITRGQAPDDLHGSLRAGRGYE